MANTKEFGSLDRGSIPLRATKMTFWIDNLDKFCLLWFGKIVGEYAPLIQWIEYMASTHNVTGLNPVGSTWRLIATLLVVRV